MHARIYVGVFLCYNDRSYTGHLVYREKEKRMTTNSTIPWKKYIYAVSETSLTFLLASFCLGMYFTHQGYTSIPMSVILVALYLFVVAVSIQRMVKTFSIAAVMLMIPIAPLLVLIVAVALIHLLQWFR